MCKGVNTDIHQNILWVGSKYVLLEPPGTGQPGVILCCFGTCSFGLFRNLFRNSPVLFRSCFECRLGCFGTCFRVRSEAFGTCYGFDVPFVFVVVVRNSSQYVDYYTSSVVCHQGNRISSPHGNIGAFSFSSSSSPSSSSGSFSFSSSFPLSSPELEYVEVYTWWCVTMCCARCPPAVPSEVNVLFPSCGRVLFVLLFLVSVSTTCYISRS